MTPAYFLCWCIKDTYILGYYRALDRENNILIPLSCQIPIKMTLAYFLCWSVRDIHILGLELEAELVG